MTEPEGRVSVSITEPRHNEASNLPQEGNHGAPLEPVSSKQSMSVIERIATALVGEPETKFQTTGILPSPEDKASRPRSRAHRDLEKHAVSDHDAFSNDSTPSLPCPMPLPPIEYSRAEYRRVIWKMDLHLIPPLASLWFISLVDRVNLGNALIQGLQDDLKFKSRDLSLIIIIPIIGIIVAEIPCNLLLKRYSPAFMLALECGLLGITSIGEGLVQSVTPFIILRFFLGLWESGIIPGGSYLIGQYYPRYELQWRLAMLSVANALATAFGGLLALGIAGIRSNNGWLSWRWIFVIEGIMAITTALLVYPFLPSWPDKAKWLTDHDRAILADQFQKDGLIGGVEKKLTPRALLRILSDWKIYLIGAMHCCLFVTVVASSTFVPTIIKEFYPHRSEQYIQTLSFPIYIAASGVCLLSAYLADRFKHRSGFCFIGGILILFGASILYNEDNFSRGTNYFALYLISCGAYIQLPLLTTLLINNISGSSTKMGIAIAVQTGMGIAGGIPAGFIFPAKDAPRYLKGYGTLIGMTTGAMLLLAVHVVGTWLENGKRDAGRRDYRLQGRDKDDLGDDHPSFRYTY